jgi:hypothetical protein
MLQEDWTPIMYDVWDGSSWWTWIYFIVLNLGAHPCFTGTKVLAYWHKSTNTDT